MPPAKPMSELYYGDNLDVLRRHVGDESVDLVYLDPPFNSARDYNVLFEEKDGTDAASQIAAFEDTWRWDAAAAAQYQEVVEGGGRVADALVSFRTFFGTNDMLAYLTMMAPRLVELHRVLRPTGSLYLHCDPTASHYLKMLLDAAFDPSSFRNEIIWKRASTVKSNVGQGSKMWGQQTDTILFYTKSNEYTFHQPFKPYTDDYMDTAYRHVEPGTGRRYRLVSMIGPGGAAKGNPIYEVMGVTKYWRYSKKKMQELIDSGLVVQTKPGTVPNRKYYLDEGKGVPVQSLWDDIGNLQASDAERLGYPTQKPVRLLDRIVEASSNPGDVVLDPFCGCGTSIASAQRLGRRWVGIDVTHLAIGLIRNRLRDQYGDLDYSVIGEPTSIEDAAQLAAEDKFQFQAWALGLVGARPTQIKKGADKGIDGRLYFQGGDAGGKTQQVIISVKGGSLKADDIRALGGVIEREKAAIGALVSFEEPTQRMRTDAASFGFFSSPWGSYPRLQLLTVGELLEGKRLEYPHVTGGNQTFKRAPKVKSATPGKLSLFEDA